MEDLNSFFKENLNPKSIIYTLAVSIGIGYLGLIITEWPIKCSELIEFFIIKSAYVLPFSTICLFLVSFLVWRIKEMLFNNRYDQYQEQVNRYEKQREEDRKQRKEDQNRIASLEKQLAEYQHRSSADNNSPEDKNK